MRYRLRDIHLRDALIVGIPVLALIIAGFWYAAQFIKPAPPKRATESVSRAVAFMMPVTCCRTRSPT